MNEMSMTKGRIEVRQAVTGKRRVLRSSLMFLWLAVFSLVNGPAFGQGFQVPSGLEGLLPAGGGDERLVLSSEFELSEDGTRGLLHVTAKLSGEWHIYSVTQKDGGPTRTTIDLEPSRDYQLAGKFVPSKKPKVKRLEFYDVPVEEHPGEVTWTAPLRILNAVAAESFEIKGEVNGQICNDSVGCVPLSTLDSSFTATYAGQTNRPIELAASEDVVPQGSGGGDMFRTPPVALAMNRPASPISADTRFKSVGPEGYRAPNVHVTMSGHLEPATAKPGSTVKLVVTATPDPDWHIYGYAERDEAVISKPTLITVADPDGWIPGTAVASEKPKVEETGLAIEPQQIYHEGTVTWTVPVKIPDDAQPGKHNVRGLLGYQTCSGSLCDRPTGAIFEATIEVASTAGGGKAPLKFAAGDYSTVSKYVNAIGKATEPSGQAASGGPASNAVVEGSKEPQAPAGAGANFDLTKIEVDQSTYDNSLIYTLMLALLGGFVLNFMPCVLPVIGLKIMSFVQQAGEDRGRVLTLNIWYSIGMLSVFWVLAFGAAFFSLGWGEQYNNDAFTITLLSVVFVMGLSFIGVWEIPIPGFVGSGTASEMASREGLGGAYFKGVLTTILATPCSGPGIAAAITWAANKPPLTVYLVFTFMGLGMALPYLVIGAFPSLVRFIPKPGPWMDTFKQTMGFVLMGTVVYLFTLLKQESVVPTLALIFAMWGACWWIGRQPIGASFGKQVMAWGSAIAFAGLVGWFAFAYEVDREYDLQWEEFSIAALDEHAQQNRTVMVDFTARWCPTCKFLERSVLNTKPVHSLVERNDVVTLVADWSEQNEEIDEMLGALGDKQLPVIAIFPAGDPYRPMKLTGFYTKEELLSKLKAAGRSEIETGTRPVTTQR